MVGGGFGVGGGEGDESEEGGEAEFQGFSFNEAGIKKFVDARIRGQDGY